VQVVGDWDPLGMRGTVSRNLLFTDVFVPETARLMPEGMYFQAASRFPHMFATLSPTYLASRRRPTTSRCSTCAPRCRACRPSSAGMYPTKQYAVAEMRIKLESHARLVPAERPRRPHRPRQDTRMRLYAAH